MTTQQKSRAEIIEEVLASLGDPSEASDDLNRLLAVQLCEKYTACPPLVGLQGFAAIMGVSYQAIQSHLNRRKKGDTPFPLPVAELPQPVWLRAQAVAYKAHRDSTPTCSFEGCGKEVRINGMCQGHYRQLREGKTLTPLRARRAEEGKRAPYKTSPTPR